MQSAFGTVLVGGLRGRGRWGAAGPVLEPQDLGRVRQGPSAARHRCLAPEPAPGSTGSALERDTEIRQLLEARNARRRRRGEPEIDVEQELARLTAPAIDAELREEIRQLVIARNHRRARQGKPPLDVEAEIRREIEALNSM